MLDATMRIEVDIPRSEVIILRRLHKNAPVKESVEQAIATFTSGWQAGVEITGVGIKEISSLLAVQTFNSEAALIEAIKKRFNLTERSVVIEVDESLSQLVRRKAHGNGLPFSEYVNRFVHSMFRFGILDWSLKTVFFSEVQWNRVKNALGSVPSTGENFACVIEEWAHLKANAAGLPSVPPPSAAKTEKPKELSPSDKNSLKAEEEDKARKIAQQKAAVGLDKDSPEYRQKLADAMNRMTAKPGKEPAPEEVFQEAEPEEQAAAAEIPQF